MASLNALKVKSLTAPGRYSDGDGLHLFVKDATRRSWVLRYRFAGRQRDMGLGQFPEVSLAEARDLTKTAREQIRRGVDPLQARDDSRRQARAEAEGRKTFRTVAEEYVAAHEKSWRNAKHRAQWKATLETYAFPKLGSRAVGDVDRDAVLNVLKPIWETKTETAKRLRGRIENVLDYAIAQSWRDEPNPARWRGYLARLLPAPAKLARVEHFAAIPMEQVAGFVKELRARVGTSARALEFLILTAARTNEVMGARWGEVDLDRRVWTVPDTRTKSARAHRVPLSDRAVAILRAQWSEDATRDALVFPGDKPGRPLSSMAFLMLLRRMKRTDITAHGFRSTFRDWAGETTSYPAEVAEAALAHVNKDKTEAAYARGDLFAKRAQLMADWAAFCDAPTAPAEVHDMRAERAKRTRG
jgi:integrase